MKNTFGSDLSLTIFGESHGRAIGAVLDGMAAGLPVDETFLAACMDKRRARGDGLSTPRVEADTVQFLSGVVNGHTTGTAIALKVCGLGVIAAAGVLVLDHQGNGRAGGVAVDHARKKLDLIGLHPGGGKTVAPGPALVHAGGNAGLVHGDACRHAVQHRADGGTMALAENGQRQRAAVSVFHGLIPPCPAGGAGPLPGWSRPASSQGRGP